MTSVRRSTKRPTIRLYASGLCVMIYSPAAARGLAEGSDTMPAGQPLREPLRSLVESEQRVVLLGVGSPQVCYAIVPHAGPPRAPAVRAARAKVTFGLAVEGGTVCVRDGYDPMEWTARVPRGQRFPMPDGYYAVHALQIEGEPDPKVDLWIAMYFEPSTKRIPGDGWPYLDYRVA